jgi:hypothetical protein
MCEGIRNLPVSMRTSFIEALSRGLDDNPRVRAYRRFNWFVLPTDEQLILGDSVCVFETGGARSFKPLDDEEPPSKRIFMPLAPARLLVGTYEAEAPHVDVIVVNEAFARCSLEFFVSARPLRDTETYLLEYLGTWSGIATDEELQFIWDEVKSEF